MFVFCFFVFVFFFAVFFLLLLFLFGLFCFFDLFCVCVCVCVCVCFFLFFFFFFFEVEQNEIDFYCISELMMATIIQRYDKESFHFKNERLTEILLAIRCHIL